jgi:hypothetical protein
MGNLQKVFQTAKQWAKDKSVYVRGANGEVFTKQTDAWVHKREDNYQSGSWVDYVLQQKADYTEKAKTNAAYARARAADCSGGVVGLLKECGYSCSDRTADTFQNQCTQIPVTNCPAGAFVFHVDDGNKNGKYEKEDRATHIGLVLDDGTVWEFKGHTAGCVIGTQKAFKIHYAGIHPILAADIAAWNKVETPADTAPTPPAASGFSFTRVLKSGCKGKDVQELKRLMQAQGYGLNLTLKNDRFATLTRAAVMKYQKDKKLTVDGKAGKNTITALGGLWGGK